MNITTTSILVVLAGSVPVWFFLISKVFRILKTRYPEKFEAIGSPHLITNNTLSNNYQFFKFLYKNEWAELNDAELNPVCRFMKVFFAVYLLVFFGFQITVISGIAQ